MSNIRAKFVSLIPNMLIEYPSSHVGFLFEDLQMPCLKCIMIANFLEEGSSLNSLPHNPDC